MVDSHMPTLARVEVTREVLLACLNHAHSTEAEEVMGLLLGDVLALPTGERVCRVSLAFPQIRTDRRKDRVETSPEQMARCTAHAERLSAESGQRTRVIGWYHSHPHITVLPSHVDVRTQAMYQLLDPGFVGIIVSAFNRDPGNEVCTVQATAFQSVSESGSGGPPMTHRSVPLLVVRSATSLERSSYRDVAVAQRTLYMEEKGAHAKAQQALKQQQQQGAGGAAAAPGCELSSLHLSCVYATHLARLLDTALGPTATSLQALIRQHALQEEQLMAQIQQLEQALAGGGARAAPPSSGGGALPVVG